MSRKTRGWLDQSGICGFGQKTGRSSGSTAIGGDFAGLGHRQTLASQALFDGLRPFTVSKKSACSFAS